MEVSFLDVRKAPWTFQRIYLAPSFNKDFYSSIPLEVTMNTGEKFICLAFKSSNETNFASCDPSVRTIFTRPSSERISKLSPIHECREIIEAKLEIIVSHVEATLNLKENQNTDTFQKILLNLLNGIVVHSESIIDLSSLSNQFGIFFVQMTNIVCEGNSKFGKFTISTKLNVTRVETKNRFESRDVIFGGYDSQLSQLKEFLNFRQGGGGIVYGPPGCGKTTLLQKASKDLQILHLKTNVSALTDTENIVSSFKQAALHAIEGSTLLELKNMDEISKELSICIKGLLEKPRAFTVIAHLSLFQNIEQGLRRPGRLGDIIISMNVPKYSQRLEILSLLLSKTSLSFPLHKIAERTPGYVGADLYLLVENMKGEDVYSMINETDFQRAHRLVAPSGFRGSLGRIELPSASWNDIGGLSDVKLKLQRSIEWPLKHSESFLRLGIKRPKGLLLYGPPGCGKTTLVRAAANASGANFLAISSASIFSPFVGDSEKTIVELFSKARMGAPTLLFIDEIEALVSQRESGSSDVQSRILSILLNEMDGLCSKSEFLPCKTQKNDSKDSDCTFSRNSITTIADNSDVIVIGATNRPELLDSALLRPGRFDQIIFVPPLNQSDRLDLLRQQTRTMPCASDVDLSVIASLTKMFSGADLESLIRESVLEALTTDGFDIPFISQNHILSTLKKIRPSLSYKQLASYEKFHSIAN